MKPYISVIIKPTLFCDTACKHCYHTPEERVPGNIPLERIDRLMRMVSEEYESAWFIWHGGEPMTLPMSFYKDVIAIEEKYFGKDTFRYGNTVQTNGLSLNRRFMAYCRQKQINVGVSYEGPYNHVLREGDVEKSLDLLSAKENKYSVSSTICAETALRQKEIYRYFADKGINVSMSPVIPAGCAACNGTVPDPDDYIKGSIEAFDEWLHDTENSVPLVPHYLYVMNYLGTSAPSDCAHNSCLTKWLCMYPDGSLYPCAKACPKEFCMGNIDTIQSLDEAFRSEGFKRILIGSIKRREKCASCEVYPFCNGGCSIDAYYEKGIEENGGDSCRIYREVFGHISKEIQNILDTKPDMDQYNPFIKDAVIGKLVNPRVVNQ